MSFARAIGSKLWKLLVSILAVFRRAICCGRRRRRLSDTPLPMTVVTSNQQTVTDLESWNSWGDEQQVPVIPGPDSHYSNNPTENNHYLGNQFAHRDNAKTSESEEVEVDFFSDMEPRYIKPKTTYVQHTVDEKTQRELAMHRLAMDELSVTQSNELGAWEEESGTWETEAECDITCDTSAVIKEERRRERERRAAERQKRNAEWLSARSKKDHLGIRVQ